MELGRSFVRPDYQPAASLRKGMYSLDNLWDGLGGLAQTMAGEIKYWFGKITMYPSMDKQQEIIFFTSIRNIFQIMKAWYGQEKL